MNMNKSQPKVSIILCTFNAESFIRETIQSILRQTFRNFELLILDDGSSDKTVDILRQVKENDGRISVFSEGKNIGPYKGLNYLLEWAKGRYIAINDHDDIWHPEKLQKQIDFLEKHPTSVGCGSAILNWYEKYSSLIYRSQPLEAAVAWHTSLVFRNEGYRYDTAVPVATDFHFIKNILCKNKKLIHNFPEPLVLRRIFGGNQNLSGQWMKKIPMKDIMLLDIGFFDKLALFDRHMFPQMWIERLITLFFNGNLPQRYSDYATILLTSARKRP